MILIIDNYDSFTYNLYQYIGTINPDIKVWRNDKITAPEVEKLNPSHIVLSPGPGFPKDAGICVELIKKLSPKIPILGVCLGHQAIGEAFGGSISHAPVLMHGKSDIITVDDNCKLFKGLQKRIEVGRYHSLIIKFMPDCLETTAVSDNGSVMAVSHKDYKTFGIQFHPESILTPDGMKIIQNFLEV